MGHAKENAAGANCGAFGNSDLLASAIRSEGKRRGEDFQAVHDSVFDFYQRRFRHALASGHCPVCQSALRELEYLCDVPVRSAGNKSQRDRMNNRAIKIMSGGQL